MAKETYLRHYTVAKNGKYMNKTSIPTNFRSIDGIAISPDKSILAIHGTMRNSDNKDLKKLEIFNFSTQKSLAIHGISYKIKEMYFTSTNSLYLLCKDGVYDCMEKTKWRPRLRQSYSGKGRVCMDMVDHHDKILILLDNSDLVIFDKETSNCENIELGYAESPLCMTKVEEQLFIGATNGVVYSTSLANLIQPTELEKPPYLGEGAFDPPEKIEYPDVRVIKATKTTLSVLFNDKTMCFYDISDVKKIKKLRDLKNHAGPIYAIDSYPSTGDSFTF